jgi:PilZ domain
MRRADNRFVRSENFSEEAVLLCWCAAIEVCLSSRKNNDLPFQRRPVTNNIDGGAPTSAKAQGAAARRYARYPLDIRVSARVFRPNEPIELWGRSIEFGQDGIGVTLTGELAPGEVATLELTLPGSSIPLKLRGLVRYRDGLRHGFEFLARDEAQRELIRKTCELLSAGR